MNLRMKNPGEKLCRAELAGKRSRPAPKRAQKAESDKLLAPSPRHKGNQSPLECLFLQLQRRGADIHGKSVHREHPDQRIVRQPARQSPTGIEIADTHHLFDTASLCSCGALADAEQLAQPAQRQMGSLGLVMQEIGAADDVDTRAGPLFRFPFFQWRGALAAKGRSEFP